MSRSAVPGAVRSRGSFRTLLLCLVLAAVLHPGHLSAWTNGGFESGDLSGWTVTLNHTLLLNIPSAQAVVPGPAPATDGVLCPPPAICLDRVFSGNHAAQIYSGSRDLGHGDWARIQQGDTVPPATPWLSFWFAAVLNGEHFLFNETQYGEDTYVEMEVLAGGSTLYSRRYSWYDDLSVLVDDGYYNADGPWMHLPWTRYYYDLSAYAGQSVTVRYTAYSCNQFQHYCWGFLDDVQWLASSEVPTPTMTPTSSPTPTGTWTPLPTATPTPTFTRNPTFTPTPTPPPEPECEGRAWPNPFHPRHAHGGTLKVDCVPSGGSVVFYTLSGEKVREIPPGPASPDRARIALWDGRNEQGRSVAPGIYYYAIREGDRVLGTGKILVIGDG